MPAPILQLLPFALVVVVALLPPGRPARRAAACAAAVTLGAAAEARVPNGNASFNLINGALLYGGLLLFVAMAVAGWKRRDPAVAAGTGMDRPGAFMEFNRVPGAIGRWAAPVLLGALLIPATWFIFTVAGPDARSLQGLRDAPFSPAGETLLAALLLPATLVLAGIWPFGRLVGGPRFAPFAALLLIVVVAPMAGDGLAHWRSAYAAWLVAGAMITAFAPRWPAILVCGGLFAIACGGPAAFPSGGALTVIASALSLRPSASAPLRRVAYLAAGACAIAGLRATLANEVVYSVLMLLAVVIAMLRTPLPALRTS